MSQVVEPDAADTGLGECRVKAPSHCAAVDDISGCGMREHKVARALKRRCLVVALKCPGQPIGERHDP